MKLVTYYSQNYAGILGAGLVLACLAARHTTVCLDSCVHSDN